MKKMRSLVAYLVVLCCMLSITGCGASSKSTEAAAPAAEEAAAYEEMDGGHYLYDNAMPEEEVMLEEAVEEESEAQENTPELSDRKLITTMDIRAETEDMDVLLYNVESMVQELGGYMENTQIWNGSAYSYGGNRTAYLTIRIPAQHLSAFVNRMAEKSNIVSQSKSIEDVTLSYVDLESRKLALETEQKRLLELLEMAETMEDILAIEDKLGEVRYELESMESQLRTYDNKINYSTVYLDISEVERLTPVEEETTWDKISNGFAESLYNVGMGLKDFFVGLIISIPYLVLWAVIIGVIVFIVFKVRKRRAKKQKQKLELLQKLSETKPEGQVNTDGK